MTRPLLCLAALALIVPAGLMSGLRTGRWSGPDRFASRIASLKQLPLQVGEWSGQEQAIDSRVFESAGVAGGVSRRYRNPQGESVTCLILCGRPGPTSVHTPEICYPGVGFTVVGDRTPFSVSDGSGTTGDSLWAVDLASQTSATPDYLRIFYGWNDGKTWVASTNPRYDFSDAPALYKMYVVLETPRPANQTGNDLVTSFLGSFLPAVRRCLMARN